MIILFNLLADVSVASASKSYEIVENESFRLIRLPAPSTFLSVSLSNGESCVGRVRSERGRTYHLPTLPYVLRLNPGKYVIALKCPEGSWKGTVSIRRNMANFLFVKMIQNWDYEEEQPTPPIRPMDPSRFGSLLVAIDSASFSEDRLTIIEEAAEHNFFTSEQVFTILKHLVYDDERLKAAKILYPKVVDPENFYIVYRAFTYSSTREALKKWIKSRKR
ncbi:MAG: DUF4476 domain-containing protein [Thermotogae bacterium]|nr:DUF4476 domain-containing protein [Thermotogota bacterium]